MMTNIDQIDKVFIKLEVGEKSLLSLMMSRTGAINRMGNGNGDPEADRFMMGGGEEEVFASFLAAIEPELFEIAGRYELPEPQGELCQLSIGFEGKGVDTGFAFSFGSESKGPPEEILNLLELALELTDPWYAEVLEKNKKNKKK